MRVVAHSSLLHGSRLARGKVPDKPDKPDGDKRRDIPQEGEAEFWIRRSSLV
jgi:hypothetical protein